MLKKFLLSIFLVLLFCSASFSRAKYQGIAGKGGKVVKTSTSTSYKLLETYPNCTITVYLAGTTTLASIYSNNSGTTKANPFTADSTAAFSFYADDRRYDIKFSGTGIITPFTLADILLFDSSSASTEINPYQFGAFGSGSSHTISAGDITAHPEWVKCEGNYTAGDQWDYVAIQESICKAFYNSTTTPNENNQNLNKPFHLKAGFYLVNKAPLITKLKSSLIYGDGQLASKITTTTDVAALEFNGLWYTTVRDISLYAGAARTQAVLEIDGNHGTTLGLLGVQGNTFENILVSGNNQAKYAVALLRQGGSGGQGDNNHFSYFHFAGATEACYYQNGFNALANKLAHGDMQAYSKYGIFIVAGSVFIEDNSFESTYGYTQIINGGWDIDASTSGVFERIIVIGNRSESNRFYHGGNSQIPVLIGNQNACGTCPTWTALTAVSLNQTTIQASVSFGNKFYRATTAGTTAAAPPVWPNSGTVADGSVVWTETEFDVVNVSAVSESNNLWIVGNFRASFWQDSPVNIINSNYIVQQYNQKDVTYLVDATSGNKTITIGSAAFVLTDGQKVTVIKTDTSANTVTVSSTYGNGIEGAGTTKVIPGGSTGNISLVFSNGSTPTSVCWWIRSKSF